MDNYDTLMIIETIRVHHQYRVREETVEIVLAAAEKNQQGFGRRLKVEFSHLTTLYSDEGSSQMGILNAVLFFDRRAMLSVSYVKVRDAKNLLSIVDNKSGAA